MMMTTTTTTTTKTFTLSTRPFFEDIDIIDSLDSDGSRRLFEDLPKIKFTLKEALEAAKVEQIDDILKKSMEFADKARKDPKIASRGLTDDEAGAISCYTLEEGEKSPYRIINQSISVSRTRDTLSSTRKFIFLLLSGLRKLPPFRPSRGQMLYRGIRVRVPTTQGEANGHQFYAKGRTVTWWGFTSTTTVLEITQSFIKGVKARTIFSIGGEDLWGYDIKAFSPYLKEEEVLIEPETKVCVNRVAEDIQGTGTLTKIEVVFQKTGKLVLEDIIKKVTRVTVAHKGERWACSWKECPAYVEKEKKYSLDGHPRIATFIGGNFCTVIGNALLPLNKVVSWSIKVLNSKENGGRGIYIGVAPSDIIQNNLSYNKYGWYLHCFDSKLHSGRPHNFSGKEYGPRKEDGGYVRRGDSVGVVMDTATGEISFMLNGVNLGVAYEGIFLDKRLVLCVILESKGDSVELVI